ncbi:hypothetical protein AWV80_02610 [Cupriavidus sp. UYMU48A]|nr:hypothetical protein AWV80_02610 [Cupriavidus sp. UYMU48A]
MIAVRLEVDEVHPLAPPTETLFPEPGGTPEDRARVMEVLTARLGAENILRPEPVPDYRPEVANAWVPAIGNLHQPDRAVSCTDRRNPLHVPVDTAQLRGAY